MVSIDCINNQSTDRPKVTHRRVASLLEYLTDCVNQLLLGSNRLVLINSSTE